MSSSVNVSSIANPKVHVFHLEFGPSSTKVGIRLNSVKVLVDPAAEGKQHQVVSPEQEPFPLRSSYLRSGWSTVGLDACLLRPREHMIRAIGSLCSFGDTNRPVHQCHSASCGQGGEYCLSRRCVFPTLNRYPSGARSIAQGLICLHVASLAPRWHFHTRSTHGSKFSCLFHIDLCIEALANCCSLNVRGTTPTRRIAGRPEGSMEHRSQTGGVDGYNRNCEFADSPAHND